MKKLEILDVTIILDEGTSIPLTFSTNDIRDISKRSTTFSQSFNIPGSAEIDKLFSFAFDASVYLTNSGDNAPGQDFNFLKKVACKYYENGYLILDGFLRLISIGINNGKVLYNVNLLGTFNNIIQDMGDDTLSVLDTGLSAFTWTFNEIKYQNSAFPYSGSGFPELPIYKYDEYGRIVEEIYNEVPFYFAPIDYGTNRKNFSNWEYSALTTSFRVSWMFNALVEHYGYNLESSFLRSGKRYTYDDIPGPGKSSGYTSFDKVTVPFFSGYVPPKPLEQLTRQEIDRRRVNVRGVNHIYPTQAAVVPVIDIIDHDIYNTYNSSAYTFTALYTADYFAKFTIDWDFTSTPGPEFIQRLGTISLLPYINGFLNTSVFGSYVNFYQGTTGATPGTYTLTYKIALKAGDKLRYTMGISSAFFLTDQEAADGKQIQEANEIKINSLSVEYSQANIETGVITNMNKFLPSDIKCKDWFLGIVKLYNLQIDINRDNDKTLVIEPFNDFYLTNYIDISDRICRDLDKKIQPLSELTSKRYIYKYKYEEDYYSNKFKQETGLEYGAATLVIGSDFTSGDNIFESVFAHTPVVDVANQGLVFPSIISFDGVNRTQFGSKLGRIYGITNDVYNNIFPDMTARFNISTSDGFSLSSSTSSFTGFTSHFSTLTKEKSYEINTGFDGQNIDVIYREKTLSVLFDTPDKLFYTTNEFPNNNLRTEYHQPLLDQILDLNSRMYTVKVDIMEEFIQDFTFRRLVMVDNVLYRVNKINYNGKDQPATFELLKAITYPPRDLGNVSISNPPTQRYVINGGLNIVQKPFPLKGITSFSGGTNIVQGPQVSYDEWYTVDGGYN